MFCASEAFVALVKQGVAYCLLPKLQIEDELRTGQLLSLCPDKELVETLYWHSWVLVKGVNKKISEQIVSVGREKLAH